MDLKELEPFLNMSPYALMILFGVWLVRWFQKEYWPHIKSKEINRESLFAQAVAPSKRDVTGNIVFLGRIPSLSDAALTNENFAYEDSKILFGFQPAANFVSDTPVDQNTFIRELPNVVFQIEEMSITNNLFETTVNWHSLPAARIQANPLAPTNETTDPLLRDASGDLTPTIASS